MIFSEQKPLMNFYSASFVNQPRSYIPIRHNCENHKTHKMVIDVKDSKVSMIIDDFVNLSHTVETVSPSEGFISIVSDASSQSHGALISLKVIENDAAVIDIDFRLMKNVNELYRYFDSYFFETLDGNNGKTTRIEDFWYLTDRRTLAISSDLTGCNDEKNIKLLTFNKRKFKNFTAIVEFEQTQYRYGIVFGCEKGEFPYYRIPKTHSFKATRGIYGYVEAEGNANFRGAIKQKYFTEKQYALSRKVKRVSTFSSTVGVPSIYLNANTIQYQVNSDAVYYFKNKTIQAKTGSILYIPANTLFFPEYTVDECIQVSISLDGSIANEPDFFTSKSPEKFKFLFQKILNLIEEKNITYFCEANSNLFKIHSMILRENTQLSGISLDNVSEKLQPALIYINKNFTKPHITIPQLAEMCYISETYFRRLYQNQYGISPQKHIQQMRINYAIFLLDSGQYKISEAAQLSGFTDTKYFTATFHKMMGTSPSRWLKEHNTKE